MENNGRIWRWGLVGLGLVVFLLLFFADKSNLTNLNPTTVAAGNSGMGGNNAENRPSLPPLAADPALDAKLELLAETEDPAEKTKLLDTIVVSLQARNRLAYASDYATQLVGLDSSLQNQLQAGVLSQQATELPYISNDSSLMTLYNNRSIALLRKVLAQEPENEAGLLHLGLALTRSPQPMQGILSLRKLTEINPQNAEAQLRLGLFSIQTGQFEKAEERLSKVLELEPDRAEASFQLAYSRVQLGKKDEARALLESVLQNNQATAELKQEARILINQL
jgi:tetratricopeptide (TPR) repeat protein